MNVYRLKNWTHYGPKRPRGVPGLRSAGFKAPSGEHAIVIAIGNIPDGMELSNEVILQMLGNSGLQLAPDAEAWEE